MTLNRAAQAAILSAVAVAASLASAADSQNMTVQARVNAACKLVAVPTLDFGLLNQATAPAVTPSAVQVQYRCTKAEAPTSFSVGGSTDGTYTGAMSTTTSTDTIAYSITWTTPSTAGSGLGSSVTPVNVALSGTIAADTYANVTAGTYTQSVAIAINP